MFDGATDQLYGIATLRGRTVNPFDPSPEDFDIGEIAHALSMLCRFGGHVRRFYSVAQHAVEVSRLIHRLQPEARGFALAGLLHDAEEAYLADLPRPVKYHPSMEVYRQTGEILRAKILGRYKISSLSVDWERVALCDNVVCLWEALNIGPPKAWNWKWSPEVRLLWSLTLRHDELRTLSPEDAEESFIARFQEITEQ